MSGLVVSLKFLGIQSYNTQMLLSDNKTRTGGLCYRTAYLIGAVILYFWLIHSKLIAFFNGLDIVIIYILYIYQ